jgi:phage recombination protein Bet
MNELTVRNNQVAVKEQVTRETVKNFLLGSGTKLTNQQFDLAVNVCTMSQLNPFKKEVHIVAYGQNFAIITAYTEYVKRGEESGLLDGWEIDTAGEGKELHAICTIYRKDWSRPFVWRVLFNEFNKGNSQWKTTPISMIKKVCIGQAFRICFPKECSALPETFEEINLPEQTSEEKTTVKKSSTVQKEPEIEIIAEPIETINREQQKLLFATLKDLNLTPDDLKFYVNANLHLESTADIPANKLDSVLGGLKLMAENKGGENE